MSINGIVKKWVMDKGFGFIEATDGSGDMFVHFRQIQGGRTTLNVGENVTYTTGTDKITGKVVAENVVGDGTGMPAQEGAGRGGFGGRGGRGGGRGVCYAFQRGGCTFGQGCRFSHEGAGGNDAGGYGAAAGAYGGQGSGLGGQGSGVYGTGVLGGVTPQARFFPYGVQAQSYGQPGAVGAYGQQGGGVYNPQVMAAAAYGQQGAAPSYGQQQSGYKGAEQSSSYGQQTSGGYPQHQAAVSGGYSQQGVVSGGYAPKPAGVARYGQQGLSPVAPQGSGVGNAYLSGGSRGQQETAPGAQASLGRGRYQQF